MAVEFADERHYLDYEGLNQFMDKLNKNFRTRFKYKGELYIASETRENWDDLIPAAVGNLYVLKADELVPDPDNPGQFLPPSPTSVTIDGIDYGVGDTIYVTNRVQEAPDPADPDAVHVTVNKISGVGAEFVPSTNTKDGKKGIVPGPTKETAIKTLNSTSGWDSTVLNDTIVYGSFREAFKAFCNSVIKLVKDDLTRDDTAYVNNTISKELFYKDKVPLLMWDSALWRNIIKEHDCICKITFTFASERKFGAHAFDNIFLFKCYYDKEYVETINLSERYVDLQMPFKPTWTAQRTLERMPDQLDAFITAMEGDPYLQWYITSTNRPVWKPTSEEVWDLTNVVFNTATSIIPSVETPTDLKNTMGLISKTANKFKIAVHSSPDDFYFYERDDDLFSKLPPKYQFLKANDGFYTKRIYPVCYLRGTNYVRVDDEDVAVCLGSRTEDQATRQQNEILDYVGSMWAFNPVNYSNIKDRTDFTGIVVRWNWVTGRVETYALQNDSVPEFMSYFNGANVSSYRNIGIETVIIDTNYNILSTSGTTETRSLVLPSYTWWSRLQGKIAQSQFFKDGDLVTIVHPAEHPDEQNRFGACSQTSRLANSKNDLQYVDLYTTPMINGAKVDERFTAKYNIFRKIPYSLYRTLKAEGELSEDYIYIVSDDSSVRY